MHEANKIIKGIVISWGSGIGRLNEFVVVNSFNDLSNSIQQRASDQDAANGIKGVHHHAKSYLVLCQCDNAAEIKKAF